MVLEQTYTHAHAHTHNGKEGGTSICKLLTHTSPSKEKSFTQSIVHHLQ